MNLLIVDHHFDQDIEALQRVAGKHRLRIVSADMFGRLAQRHFPIEVFYSLLGETYGNPEFEDARKRHCEDVRTLLMDCYSTFPFDVLVAPSDTIPAFRPFSHAAHELGVPFVIVQKETTISPYTMTEDARVIGETLPFTGDLMLACSENHKRFWINTGADPGKIIVTGQPRFDFYSQKEQWKSFADLGLPLDSTLPTVLFLSYDVGAYSPEGVLSPTWLELLEQTERALVEQALATPYNLIVKPHPQQQNLEQTRDRLAQLAGKEWGRRIRLIPARTDLRHLTVNVNTVVGFQTTAMFEAMAAGKKVIYTFWSEPTSRYLSALIPFHEMNGAVQIARSPEELQRLIKNDAPPISDQERLRSSEVELQLGPIDGHASRRVICELERFVEEYQVAAESRARRRHSFDTARRARPRILLWAGSQMITWALLEALIPVGYPAWTYLRRYFSKRHPMAGISAYRRRCKQGRREAFDTLTYGIRSFSATRP